MSGADKNKENKNKLHSDGVQSLSEDDDEHSSSGSFDDESRKEEGTNSSSKKKKRKTEHVAKTSKTSTGANKNKANKNKLHSDDVQSYITYVINRITCCRLLTHSCLS